MIIFIYLFIHINKKNLVYIESIDGNKYMVNNIDNKEISANLLSQINKRIFLLKDYLFKNINKFLDKKNDILLLNKNLNNRTKIYETEIDSKYTSYSVNKGEELVFCLRSKKTTEFHDINLLMYVALHEISHLACKEIGHTQLFKDIRLASIFSDNDSRSSEEYKPFFDDFKFELLRSFPRFDGIGF